MANSAVVDASGNVYVVGDFVGTVDFDPDPVKTDIHTSAGGTIDAFLAKFGSDGTFQWARTWGGPAPGTGTGGRDTAGGVGLDSAGNVYVCGNFQYTVDFNPDGGARRTSNAGSMNNPYLAKYSPDGTFQWVQTWGPSDGGSDGYSLAVDGWDNIYVVGDFAGSGAYFNNPYGGTPSDWHANHPNSSGQYLFFDAYLTKYDANGTFQWARTWGGEGYDDGPGVAVDRHGNVYVAGMYASQTIDFDPAGSGVTNHPASDSGILTDVFLSKFDGDGHFQWVRTWGGQGATDAGETVAVDRFDSVYVGGRFASVNCNFNPGGTPDLHSTNGDTDAFVAKFDTNGTFQWARTWGGTGADATGGLYVDGAANVYATGNFYGTANVDQAHATGTIGSNGQSDAFFVKWDASGTYQWAKTWGGTGSDWAGRSASDGAGTVYVVGSFQNTVDLDPSPGVDNHTSNGGADAFLVKFASAVAAPTLTGVTPSGGTIAGGTRITVSGTGFVGAPTVTVGGLPATGVAIVSETTLTAITPAHSAGTVDVAVTTAGGPAAANSAYTYLAPPVFTDTPLVPRVTVLKAVHLSELRDAVGALRGRYALASFGWTDTVLSATVVKAIHITELRAALSDVYLAAGLVAPAYTGPPPAAGTVAVAATHIAELRAAVLAIW